MYEPSLPASDPEAENCAEELRAALAAHGIVLPSLGIDPPVFASTLNRPLIALGNCNMRTAQALIDVLRKGVA
ncbi:hypothetical protein [Streptomyces sp. NPDC058045]|uniref:hypothetical protein n=1 Tax=Streptomyces sp. NPDC058045 TaxID=3346311 RepID=UPI0036E71E6C